MGMVERSIYGEVRENYREVMLFHEEIFAPVALLVPFDNLEMAIEAVNERKYGLGRFTSTDIQGTELATTHLVEEKSLELAGKE